MALSGWVWVAAGAFVVLELALSARYGFHRDELYFVIAGRRPAFGYVDQPPLAPLLARLSSLLLGTSPSAIRILPALAGGGVVISSAQVARALGGRGEAQLLAAVAVGCAPVLLAAAHLANTTVYDLLAWSLIELAVILAVCHGREPAWLAAGLVAGAGLENKDLPLLLVGAVGVGLLVTGRGRVLANRWFVAGALVAVALWLPNLIWQATHGWPELAMSRALRREHSAGSDYAGVLPAELLYLGPASVPLAVVGLRELAGRRALRFLAVAVLLVLAFVVLTIPGRPYYADGLLPVVFAAGAIRIERRRRAVRRWIAAPIVWAVASLPIVLPVLPVSVFGQMGFMHKLNYDMGETVGWPQLAVAVARVRDGLAPAQRRAASVFTSNYGEAAAVELYGRRLGLPAALSGHNQYWLWGPGRQADAVVIAVGSAGQLGPFFSRCRLEGTFHSPQGVNNDENGVPISVCTHPSLSWRAMWPRLRHYD